MTGDQEQRWLTEVCAQLSNARRLRPGDHYDDDDDGGCIVDDQVRAALGRRFDEKLVGQFAEHGLTPEVINRLRRSYIESVLETPAVADEARALYGEAGDVRP